MKNLFFIVFLLSSISCYSQVFSISGNVEDEEGSIISLANVLLYSEGSPTPVTGSVTNENGFFTIEDIDAGNYKLEVSYIGYKPLVDTLFVSKDLSNLKFILMEGAENLDETVITAKAPTIKKTANKLTFNVENTSLSVGNSLDLLKKTPGVLVLNDEITIKNQSTLVYLNGKRVYLSSNETASFLRNLDASLVKSVEVITNPSSQYDADASTVLNITTTRSVATGYKGNVNLGYEQGTFPKYQIGTAQFFKNDWVNLYVSYGFSPRKELKEDYNFTRFFEPDETTTSSFLESDFTRITHSEAHQANTVLDFTINEKNTLSISANGIFTPYKKYDNSQDSEFLNAEKNLDSFFISKSEVDINNHNLSLNAEYSLLLTEKTSLKMAVNYVDYYNSLNQDFSSDYFLPNGDFTRTNSFYTDSDQKTKIVTANVDVNTEWFGGKFDFGAKYSTIDTESEMDFFDTNGGSMNFNSSLSDLFMYDENIFAGYVNYNKGIEKFEIDLGLRAEQTDINGDSRSLGLVNTQEYFKLFPRATLSFSPNDDHNFGISYRRTIDRPHYSSLNPFRYFLNEYNYNEGNPNLTPSFEDKITVSYSYKNKLFLEAYYEFVDNYLRDLSFQDNENRTLRYVDMNMLYFMQYSFDAVYVSRITNWWYFNLVSSFYFLENKFYAVESAQNTFTNSTYGAYGQIYSNFTLSKDGSFTSDLTATYLSDFISGSLHWKNQFFSSVSFSKKLWKKRATLTVGVDDVFNTNNVKVVSQYYNQDNTYFPRVESRLFKLGFKYNFGNFRLQDNNRGLNSEESDRLNEQ